MATKYYLLVFALIASILPAHAGFNDFLIKLIGVDTYYDSKEYKSSDTCKTLWYTKFTTGKINLNWAGDVYLDEKRLVNNRNFNTYEELSFAERENQIFQARAYKECPKLLLGIK